MYRCIQKYIHTPHAGTVPILHRYVRSILSLLQGHEYPYYIGRVVRIRSIEYQSVP